MIEINEMEIVREREPDSSVDGGVACGIGTCGGIGCGFGCPIAAGSGCGSFCPNGPGWLCF